MYLYTQKKMFFRFFILQGYFRVVGRKKDLIIRGGYNIYPREIEELFYKHPSVLEVAIVGLHDTVLGEVKFQ
jgi:acyl-CoA synthetase (AMP-forming)/AMP-acid ligase II